jgi:hypothetical protein
MRRITGSNFVRCAATADRLGDASRRRGSAALNRNVRRSSARRRAAFRPPIRTAQSTPSILGTLPDGPNAQRRRNSELARPIRRDFTWAVPVVVDDFPQEIPITRRELDVIETYLGALLDEALGVPE